MKTLRCKKSQITLGLVGCGAAARKYYLPILRLYCKTSKDMYFVDKNIDQAQKMATEVGSQNYFDDYHEILDKVRGVIIAVPNLLHHSIAIDFLQNKTHVLCEKPLAESANKAREMVWEAERNDVKLCVNNTRRMFPSFRKVKELISNGEIGELSSIRYFEANKFDWESETGFYVNPNVSTKGVLFDLGAHVLDLICWWINGKPDLISFEDDSFGGPESLAYVEASKGGCEIEIRLNRLVDLENHFIVSGDKGSIEGDPYDWKTVRTKQNSGKTKKINIKSDFKSYCHIVRSIISNFIEVVARNEIPLISGADVINSIELIEQCYANRSRLKMPWYHNLESLIDG